MAERDCKTSQNENTDSEDLEAFNLVHTNGFSSSLIPFSFKSLMFVMVLLGIQYGDIDQSINSYTSGFKTNFSATEFSSTYPSVYSAVTTPTVYFTEQKNRTGSDDDSVRLNPESSDLAIVVKSIAKEEVKDETIHPEDYTPHTSEAFHQEAVNQRSGTFPINKKPSSKQVEEEPFGSVVYTGAHFREFQTPEQIIALQNATNVSPKEVYQPKPKPIIHVTSKSVTKSTVKSTPVKRPTIVKSNLSKINISSLKHSAIAAREETSITYSVNASTTKQTNESYNSKVDETEALASASLTKELVKSGPEITSSLFLDLQSQSLADGKIIMLRFSASWCVPCKIMEENVYKNSEVKTYMDKNFLAMNIDTETFDGINLKQIYNVKLIPSVLFIKGNGELVGQYNKTMSAERMMKVLKTEYNKNNKLVKTTTKSSTKSEHDNSTFETYTTPIAK